MVNNSSAICASASRTLGAPLALLACFATAACGGGSHVASVVTPPPPTVVAPSNPLEPSKTTTFGSSSAVFSATTTQSTGVVTSADATENPFYKSTISYDPTTDTYHIDDATGADLDQKTFDNATKSTVGNFTTYTVTSGSKTDTVNLYNPTGTAPVKLTYVSYILWSSTSCNCDTSDRRDRFYAAGETTDPTNMPRTGSGTYQGVVDGYAAINGTAYRLLGSTGSLGVDFASGVVTSTLSLNGNSDLNNGTAGTNTGLGTVTGTGTIGAGSSQFNGTYDGTLPGSFIGSFFGPSAEEAGLSFALKAANGSAAAGVFVGKR